MHREKYGSDINLREGQYGTRYFSKYSKYRGEAPVAWSRKV